MCPDLEFSLPLKSEQVYAANVFESASTLVIRSILYLLQVVPLGLQLAYTNIFLNMSCQDLWGIGFDMSKTNCSCAVCTSCSATVMTTDPFYFNCKYSEYVVCSMDIMQTCMMAGQTTCPSNCALPSTLPKPEYTLG